MTRLHALAPDVDEDQADDEGLGNVAHWPSLPALRRSAERLAGRVARTVSAVPSDGVDRLRRPPVDVARLAHGVVTVPRGALLCDLCSEPYAERRGVLSTICPPCRVWRNR